MTLRNRYLIVLTCLLPLTGCVKDGPGERCPPPDYEIVISEIADIPANVTFDRVEVDIYGSCWKAIATVTGENVDGTVVLTLPGSLAADDLQQSVRSGNDDLCGHWLASSDNPDARVAGLRDMIAYNGEKRVGRVYVTDWPRSGTIVGKSWVYYHFADRPFTLSGTYGTYRYAASFARGWNAYCNTNLSERTGTGTVLCTTSIPTGTDFVWRFESWVY